MASSGVIFNWHTTERSKWLLLTSGVLLNMPRGTGQLPYPWGRPGPKAEPEGGKPQPRALNVYKTPGARDLDPHAVLCGGMYHPPFH